MKLPVVRSANFVSAFGACRPLAWCVRVPARRVFFCVEARTRFASREPHGPFLRISGISRTFFTLTDGKLSQVQSSNLLLPARVGLPTRARSLASGFAWTRTAGASLIQAVTRKRKVQSQGSIATTVDWVPGSSVRLWVHEDMRVL